MLFKEIIPVYTENNTKHTDTKCRVTGCKVSRAKVTTTFLKGYGTVWCSISVMREGLSIYLNLWFHDSHAQSHYAITVLLSL
jgi:hypothetical protein